MVKIKRVKRARTKRILRVRNLGFTKLANSFERIIKKTTFNKTDTLNKGREIFKDLKSGFKPTKPKELLTFFGGLNTRMNLLVVGLAAKYSKAFEKGGDKVLDVSGNKIKLPKPNYDKQISIMLKDNFKYVKNVTGDQRNKMFKVIEQGIKDGKSYDKIAPELSREVKGISITRSKLIARNEVSKAMNQGTIDTMRANGIDEYMWVTANDNRVAPLDQALHKRVFKFGQTGMMNVKGTDGKTYKIHKSPIPIRDSHIRCRCILTAPTK